MSNLEQCINEYLAFQHLYSNISWKEGYHNRTYDEYTECPRKIKVSNGEDAHKELLKFKHKFKNNNNIGILISSGIDSATISKLLPENSLAFYATYKERENDPEIDIVKQYCFINKLKLIIVEVSWEDYKTNMKFLMKVKKNPIHPCEVPVYMCCKKAVEMGVEIILSGWGADTHFGGMSKLLSRDWSFEEFKKRYEYCPRIKEDNLSLDLTYKDYIKIDKNIDIQKFLTFNYHIMTLKSFFYIPEILGLIHIPVWGFLGIKNNLDLKRIRDGNPKYIIQETFKIMYKDDNLPVTEKIPFTRPTDIYMGKYFNEYDYVEILNKYLQKYPENSLSSQQLWMIYNLNFFIKFVLLEDN